MIETPTVAGFDIVELCLYLFFAFFLFLVLYLQRESRREGYPVEADSTGRVETIEGWQWFDKPKAFLLPHGQGVAHAPNGKRETRPLALARTAVWPGATHVPTGDPLVDGVGPASWAERADVPDLMHNGAVKIRPLSQISDHFSIVKQDADPRGMTVVGFDKARAGQVVDVWVDQAESLIRYLEVKVDANSRHVLLPMFMCTVSRARNAVTTDSVTAAQFANAPGLARQDQITLLEEEKVQGYFGGGYLYATPGRAEPLA